MTVQAYSAGTSVAAGASIDFHLNDFDGTGLDATMTVTEFATGQQVLSQQVHAGAFPTPDDPAADRGWPVGVTLDVPAQWNSGLYFADFAPGHGTESRVYFVVRAARPGAATPILVSIPFPTWHAYSYAGIPGASPYWNEQVDRAARVSVRRPVDPPAGFEAPTLKWLHGSGLPVEYCSGYDLHDGADLLAGYRLLVCVGHDEYWTTEMRDTVEGFLARGGNVAFFSGNTCWWQFRLEDGGDTFVCYRDACADPLTGQADRLVTVEWGSAPVNRPENSLTGVSFRHGAGCWLDESVMAHTSWTTRFPEHWVFAGTGLAKGAAFGTGTIGYEVDAADTVDESGIPRVTGRDGTPPSFVVLATADLGTWRSVGQGGSATMGVHRTAGGGTVFTASTVGWGNGLAAGDPVVDRITRNVLTKLSNPYPAREWERIGGAVVTSMVAAENRLYATDAGNVLWVRDPVGQNLLWTAIGQAIGVRAMASQREAMGGQPIGIFAVDTQDRLWRRDPGTGANPWALVGTAPVLALAASYDSLYGVRADGALVALPLSGVKEGAVWTEVGRADGVVTMTNLNGRLYAVRGDGQLRCRVPVTGNSDWTDMGPVPGTPKAIAGWAGKLFLANTAGELYWRDAVS